MTAALGAAAAGAGLGLPAHPCRRRGGRVDRGHCLATSCCSFEKERAGLGLASWLLAVVQARGSDQVHALWLLACCLLLLAAAAACLAFELNERNGCGTYLPSCCCRRLRVVRAPRRGTIACWVWMGIEAA